MKNHVKLRETVREHFQQLSFNEKFIIETRYVYLKIYRCKTTQKIE